MAEFIRRIGKEIEDRQNLDPSVFWLKKSHHAFRFTPTEIGRWEKWSINFLESSQSNREEIAKQILQNCSEIKTAAAIEMLTLFANETQKDVIQDLQKRLYKDETKGVEKVERSSEARLKTKNLNIFFGKSKILNDVNLEFKDHEITAIIGRSGCGKSTLLRVFNRLHEVSKGDPRAEGAVFLDGKNIYDKDVNPVRVRKCIGMVFQKPNPFSTMSIYDNVIAGQKLNGLKQDPDLVENSLKMVGLWDEVKTRLQENGARLSGGQQQRLCIARAIANNPEVLLLDEPCSALDVESTERIEKLLEKLKTYYTIIIVTHNMRQAKDISKYIVVLADGEVVAADKTQKVFRAKNKHPEVERLLKDESKR